jgi:hypothetical protein
MKCLAIFGCAFIWLGPLNAQLSLPQPGFARYSDGSVHLVVGIPGNLIVEARALSKADCASFSDSGGLTSSNGLIRIMNASGAVQGEYQSGEARPVLNIDSSLRSAVAWLASKHALLGWNGTMFTEVGVDDSSFAGKVTFVRLASAKIAELFVEFADSSVSKMSVSLPAGQLIASNAEPASRGAVFVQQGWMLSQNGGGLVGELPDGNRQTVELSKEPLPADDLTIERMSTDWLHVSSRSTGTDWAVYLSSGKTSVSLLPPPTREAAQ